MQRHRDSPAALLRVLVILALELDPFGMTFCIWDEVKAKFILSTMNIPCVRQAWQLKGLFQERSWPLWWDCRSLFLDCWIPLLCVSFSASITLFAWLAFVVNYEFSSLCYSTLFGLSAPWRCHMNLGKTLPISAKYVIGAWVGIRWTL